MIFKINLIIIILLSFELKSQRRNYFPSSDIIPNCKLVKNGNFSRDNNKNNEPSFTVKFRNNKMKEIYGKNLIVIKSKLHMVNKCSFEGEIKKIRTRLAMNDSTYFVGKKTTYEIIETGKNYIIYEYWCNYGQNKCTEILDNE